MLQLIYQVIEKSPMNAHPDTPKTQSTPEPYKAGDLIKMNPIDVVAIEQAKSAWRERMEGEGKNDFERLLDAKLSGD